MTWQTIAYFSSIVLTFLLTGFLAWFAWKRRSIPGAGFYAGMALGECLLALAEILSMISSSQAQALFWFNVRFLFIAVVPVFFLLFALNYHGHKDWVSPWLMAAAFSMPVITQVMLWSNSLHHFWLVQEVSFRQVGSFWIAVTGDRIPALWFMVHSFYSLILLAAGIGVILATAWKERRLHRSQALLLAAGALVALSTSILSVFNLIPEAEYNVFIPGIGASVLFYALAIFRFQFLKTAPAGEDRARMTNYEPQERRSLAIILLIYLLIISGFIAAGYFSYKNIQRNYRSQAEEQLLSIVSLKVNELENWRNERLGDGEVFLHNPAFSALVQQHLDDPSDPQGREQLQAWLDSTLEAYQYHRILLMDSRGELQITSPAGETTVPVLILDELPSVLQSGQVTFQDFHRHTDGSIYIRLLVPILANQEPTVALGMLVMEVDPTVYFYPYLSQWPVPSETGETLLVRREGEEVLFLNPLRFAPEAALHLHLPLTDTDVLAVKAALGETGIVEGVDYRGEEVLGATAPVPGTPWFIVARMDKAEVNAPLRASLWQTIFTFGALILASGASLGLFWRRQRMHSYQERLEIAEALQESEEKFRKAFLISPDGISITRLTDGKFVLVNHGFEQILGYSEQEVIGKTSLELDIWVNPADRERIVTELQAAGRVSNFEAQFRARNGEIRHGLMSVVIIELNGETHILNTTRDITERKQAEEAIKAYSERLEEMVEERTKELKDAQEKMIRQERLATLGEVAGSISHELRNPLGVITNAIYFLKMSQPEANEKIKEYLNIIEAETHNSEKIISDLLDFARIKSVDKEAVSIPELVTRVLERYPAPEGVTTSKKLQAKLPTVLADPSHIEHVLGNLVVNAYHAMTGGGRLTISAETKGGEVILAVKDSGIGIPMENVDKIFEPLFTTKSKGIGLGLAVSKKLIEANNGRIEVQSKPGAGTIFSVFLPIDKTQKENQ